jgi:hypothetical protein
VPRAERRRRLDAALAASGLGAEDLASLRVEDAHVLSRARLRWTVTARPTGAGTQAGSVSALHVELLMDPRREGLVQSLETTAR